MKNRFTVLLALLPLLAASCGAAAPDLSQQTSDAAQVAASTPASVGQPAATSAASDSLTLVPATTAPTSPPPTAAPTSFPAAASQPTVTAAADQATTDTTAASQQTMDLPVDQAATAPSAPLPPTEVPSAPVPGAEPAATGGTLLFLRDGDLWSHRLSDGQEQRLAGQVQDFAATPDGSRIAVVRLVEAQRDLWTLRADGSELQQLTSDERSEGRPSWAPDGNALVFATSTAPAPSLTPDWFSWSAWCRAAEVRIVELPTRTAQVLGAGCDPVFGPDGKRVAFASPPQRQENGYDPNVAGAENSIRLVNRQGQNGWDFARAGSITAQGDTDNGLLVYAPSWSPRGDEVAFQRFVGYRALVDLAFTEIAPAFKGGGDLASAGAGWLFPPHFSRDGRLLAVAEHNFSDARGFGGYEPWSVTLLRLGQPDSIALPEGEVATQATRLVRIARAQSAAWHPALAELVLLLPNGWSATTEMSAPAFEEAGPGELRRWSETAGVGEVLVSQVDFASPLAWLP